MILLILPRRGMYQLTKCQNCGYVFECQNCSNQLTAHRTTTFSKNLELICHQCQSYYQYPKTCPSCHHDQILSLFSGIEDLSEKLAKDLESSITRLDLIKSFPKIKKTLELAKNTKQKQVFITTRLFDPAIDYSYFDKIIFLKAEQLLASPDYLVKEEVLKQLAEVFLQTKSDAKVIFDSTHKTSLLESLQKLLKQDLNYQNVMNWYFGELKTELESREKFLFPPFWNLILVTSQEKQHSQALQKIDTFKKIFTKKNFPNLNISSSYPARLLKRKNHYSYHLLIKFPKQYQHFFDLQQLTMGLSQKFHLQLRLNPRNIF